MQEGNQDKNISQVMSNSHVLSEGKEDVAVEASRVTSMVLHDVRSPLFYLDKIIFRMYNDAGPDMPDNCREQLRELYLSVKSVTGHIQNLFTWINMVQGQMVVSRTGTELFPLLEAIVGNYQLLALQNDSVLEFYCERDFMMTTHPELLNVILRNLVDNAIKNTRNGIIRIRATKKEDRILILVEDNGKGMGSEKTEQLLNPASAAAATGMGYRYIHDILKMLNATMNIQSKPGKGTGVYLYFPGY